MKQLLFALLILVGLNSCDDDEKSFPQCEFTDPLEDLEWLKEYKENLKDCYTIIYAAVYKRNIVFYSVYVNPAANTIWRITLWDCEGNTVKIFDREDKSKYEKLVTHNKIIYRCNPLDRFNHH